MHLWWPRCLGVATGRPFRHRMNVVHLSIPGFWELLENLWAGKAEEAAIRGWDEETLFFKSLEGTRKVDRCYGKRRALERKEKISRLQLRLARAHVALESTPDEPIAQREVMEAREILSSFDTARAAWVEQILEDRWLAAGDRGTQMSFQTFRIKSLHSQTNPGSRRCRREHCHYQDGYGPHHH